MAVKNTYLIGPRKGSSGAEPPRASQKHWHPFQDIANVYYAIPYFFTIIKANLLSKLRISIITELETQLIGKDYKNELLILSLIYFRTAFFKGWVPKFLSPAGPGDNLKRDAPGTSLRDFQGIF